MRNYTTHYSWAYIWILELGEVLTAKKEDGTIHDRIACGVYLRAVFISLAVDVWELRHII